MDNQFSSVVDALPGLVWTALPDGQVDFVNQEWCVYTGRSREQARGHGWLAAVYPEDLPALLQQWRSLLEGCEPAGMEARLRRFDGEHRRFLIRVRPLTDAAGKVVRWCGINTDIEDCRSSGASAYLHDVNFRSIADCVPGLLSVMSGTGELEYVNRQTLDYLGASLEELKDWAATDTVHPDDLPGVIAAWTRSVQSGDPYDVEHRIRRADGTYRWFHVRGLPLRDSRGAIIRWCVLEEDIDDQRQDEALIAGEKMLLEMVVRGQSKAEVIDALCRLVETTIGGCRCYIVLRDTDGTHSTHSTTATHPTALPAGWRTPITADAGEVLGAIEIDYGLARSPSARELALIDQLSHIVSIVVERQRSQTSLAQALNELRASDDRLRTTVDAMPGFAWRSALDGSVEFLNQRWCDYTGLSLDESLGSGWTTAIHPDDAQALGEYWQGLLQGTRPGEFEARLRSRDGEFRWFLIRAVPLLDAAGHVLKWYGQNTDIDDRKRAELLLAGEKELLKMIAEGDALVPVLDSLCALIEATIGGSTCSIQLTNARRSPHRSGMDAPIRLRAGTAPNLPARLQQAVDVAPDNMDASPGALAAITGQRVVSSDLGSETRWGAWCSTAVSHGFRAACTQPIVSGSGQVIGTFTLLYRDASAIASQQEGLVGQFSSLASIAIERTRGEAALQQSGAFLAKAQRLSMTGTFSWRVATNEITWSDEVYRIYGFDPSVTPTYDLIQTRLHPDDSVAYNEVRKRQRVDGRDFEHEHRLLMPDGSVKYLHLVAQATRDESGGLEYIAALQDVTQRRLSEEALAKVRSELAHVSRVATLGALTASIAHEVNQPLAGIITNANTCLRMLGAEPPNVAGARETAKRTIRDGERASDVIKRLRALFARKDLATGQVDLNEAAREVVAMLQGELHRSSVVVLTEYAADLPQVTGDRVQLQQVILNLLVNAIDAMSGIAIRLRQIVIRTGRSDGGQVCLTVQDGGVGFDPLDAEKLFTAFYTTKSGGMGIGLSISRSIIESHDGRLWAASNNGAGSAFSFSLPCTPDSDVATHEAQQLAADDVGVDRTEDNI